MSRRIRIAIAAAVISAAGVSPAARAQWAYQPYGWGGWGGAGSIQGDVAQGMGVFAAGMGQYNEQTAVARSIETDTRMRLNEYLWRSEQVRRQQQAEQSAAQRQRTNQAIGGIQDRVLNNPDRSDIVSGDSLNAILHELRAPSVADSLLENAASDLTLTGAQVKLIPLRFASKGVVISAHRLAAENAWPAPLQAPAFTPLRDRYRALVEEARNLPEEQEIPDEKIVEGIQIVNQMRALAQEQLSGPEFAAAERYLKAQAGLLQMARQPNIRQVLEAAYKKETIPLANAILGMDSFNLSFGKADDPAEQEVYLRTLYPMMAELRSRVAQQLGGKIPTEFQASVGEEAPTGAFEKLDWEQLGRTAPHPEAPHPEEPPAPGAPN
ncbi:hypothetical protein [Tautonia plasticadhaerens]|uniref:Uncharacterized protein n=1 Tax=Tautonia plasticadhaerens TaxID=2527974 RepID=A0A518GW40_9BACT|nr:hypothetical protein [Tautonia plasticadhaerens]QDV32813.1 hypothetical protein ElP_06530 [Tautonia plasticadhaerens]